MPPFETMPTVVVWGSRTFEQAPAFAALAGKAKKLARPIYRECFGYWAPQAAPATGL